MREKASLTVQHPSHFPMCASLKTLIVRMVYVMLLCFAIIQLKEVVLKSGKVLRADVCVIGTGEHKDK